MRLLDRYLLRELLLPLGYCLGGFLIFWVSFDLFSELGEFQTKKLHGSDILEYYFVKTPEMLSVVLPVALLLALLYALTNHARYHELTAMRAAGVSLWRLAAPYFIVGFLFSGILFAINEFWVPRSLEQGEQILNRYNQNASKHTQGQQELFFQNAGEKRDWHASNYDLNTQIMTNVHVKWDLPDGSWRDLYAESASWSNGFWTFLKVQEWNYKSKTDSFPVPTLTNSLARPEFLETPQLIRSEIKINNLSSIQAAKRPQLSIQEIRTYLRFHPNLGGPQLALLQTQFHGRIASAWTCLVVVLIAIPFGAPSGRRNVFVGVAASIFICFAFFILLRLGLTLGTGGFLPAWAAAWLPNILFGGGGFIMTMRVR